MFFLFSAWFISRSPVLLAQMPYFLPNFWGYESQFGFTFHIVFTKSPFCLLAAGCSFIFKSESLKHWMDALGIQVGENWPVASLSCFTRRPTNITICSSLPFDWSLYLAKKKSQSLTWGQRPHSIHFFLSSSLPSALASSSRLAACAHACVR